MKEIDHGIELYDIDEVSIDCAFKAIKNATDIIIGFPIYGSMAPKNMLEFISKFPQVTKMNLHVYGTHALGSGDSSLYVGNQLVNKGYRLKQADHFVMMNNFHIPSFRFYKPKNNEKLTKILKRRESDIATFVGNIHGEVPHVIGKNIFGHLLGSFQRHHIEKVVNKINSQLMIEENRCTKCQLCIKLCPVKNISMIENEIVFDKKCLGCLRCYSKCPSCALLVGKKSNNITKYPRYKGPNYLEVKK